jgi:hypothetical protein
MKRLSFRVRAIRQEEKDLGAPLLRSGGSPFGLGRLASVLPAAMPDGAVRQPCARAHPPVQPGAGQRDYCPIVNNCLRQVKMPRSTTTTTAYSTTGVDATANLRGPRLQTVVRPSEQPVMRKPWDSIRVVLLIYSRHQRCKKAYGKRHGGPGSGVIGYRTSATILSRVVGS